MLTDGDFWVVVQPDLIKDRLVQRLQDVADLPWLLEDQMMERNSMVEREGVNIDKLNVTVLATNSLVMSAAKAGLGVTIQPKSLVQGDVQAGGLAKVCELNQENLGYYIVVLAGREPKGLRPFLSWLRSQAAE